MPYSAPLEALRLADEFCIPEVAVVVWMALTTLGTSNFYKLLHLYRLMWLELLSLTRELFLWESMLSDFYLLKGLYY
jgi:hypothetical protein